MKKIVSIIVVFVMACAMLTGCGNYDLLDTQFTFDYAYIELPNGEVIEGEIEQWSDYDGDQLQIKIDGVIYVTDTTRAVMIAY